MFLSEDDTADSPAEGPHTNAQSMGNKQEESETTVLQSYNLVAIMETWWGEPHDWSVAIDGYRLFRRDW